MDIRIYNLENKVASDIERQYHAYENIHVHIDVTYIYIYIYIIIVSVYSFSYLTIHLPSGNLT